MANDLSIFAKQFSRISQAINKQAFEVRFDSLQRGILQRRDKEVAAVLANDVEQQIATLEKKRNRLAERSNTLIEVQNDLKTNAIRLNDIAIAAQETIQAADADGNGTLSADEVAALNTALAEISGEVAKLKLTANVPEFTDGNLANRMRHDIETLAGLTAVEGVIDPEGTEPATNDNRAILDTLDTITGRATTYSESSSILVFGLNQFIIDTQKSAFAAEADLAELTTAKLAEQNSKIEDLDIRYGNLIRAISLAFEVNSGTADMLVTGTQPDPPKGSILNLFA
jgi:hypothetical protein